MPKGNTTSPQTTQPSSDQAIVSFTGDTFTNLVNEAKQIPEVRSELVDAYKTRIYAKTYPPEDVVAGFIRLIGGGIKQLALSNSPVFGMPSSPNSNGDLNGAASSSK